MFKNFFKYVFTFKKNVVPDSIRNSVEAVRSIIGIIGMIISVSILKPINKRIAAYTGCIELFGIVLWGIR